MKDRNKSKTYQVKDSVLVEISTVARVTLEDLEIYPDGMSLDQIKAKLVKEFSNMLEDTESFKVGMFKVNILDKTTTSRSVLVSQDEETE